MKRCEVDLLRRLVSCGVLSLAATVWLLAPGARLEAQIDCQAETLWGPFSDFGTGLTDGVPIGMDCDGIDITQDGQNLTVVGAGFDIWDNRPSGDEFVFAYAEVSGDFIATVTVASEGDSDPRLTDWGKHGILARQDCDQLSRYAGIFNNHGPEVAGSGTVFQDRREAGVLRNNRHGPTGPLLNPLRLDRVGNVFAGYGWDNGAGEWVKISPDDWGDWGDDAPETVLIGLGVSGGNTDGNPDCTLYDVTFTDWFVGKYPPTRTLATVTPASENGCTPPQGPVDVTVQRNLLGRDPTEAVTVVERVLGDEVARTVIAPDDVIDSQVVDIASGAQITWNTTRGDLDRGLGYRVNVLDGEVRFEGDVDGDATVGGTRVQLAGGLEWGPFDDFGSGLTRGYPIGIDCPGLDITQNGQSLTITGSGFDIWDTRTTGDEFLFAYQEVAGDFTATVTVASEGDTHPRDHDWGKHGILARQDCNQLSRYAAILNNHGPGVSGSGTVFQDRVVPVARPDAGYNRHGPTGPLYNPLRLDRFGNVFTGYGWDNGAGEWVKISPDDWGDWGDDAPETVLLGLGVSGGSTDTETPDCTLYDVTFTDWNFGRPATRTAVADTPADLVACTPGEGPVNVTIQDELQGRNPDEVVRVVEEVRGEGVDASVISAPDATVEDIVFDPGPIEPVGVFADWLAIGRNNPGCVGQPGESSVSEKGDIYDVASMGGDIWQGGDFFTFVYSKVRGEPFSLTARIVPDSRVVHPETGWGKVGLMIREDLPYPSPYGFVFEPNSIEKGSAPGIRWAQRTEGTNDEHTDSVGEFSWLQIERVGDTLNGFASVDGADWMPVGSTPWTGSDEVLVGLAISSGSQLNDCGELPSSVQFDEVELFLAAGAEEVPLVPGELEVLGAEIVWDVSRGELDTGIGYSVGIDAGRLSFHGTIDGDPIAGPPDFQVFGDLEEWGPFPGFGSGLPLTKGHVIGISPECSGTSVTQSDQELTIVGSGYDIWDHRNGDEFLFAYGEVAGDFSAEVTVASRGDTHPIETQWGKHGIMARQDCSQLSRYTMMSATEIDKGENFNRMQFRTVHGERSSGAIPAVGVPVSLPPQDHIRLDRVGNEFIGYFQLVPGEWTEMARHDWGDDAPETVLLGLAVDSGPVARADPECTLYDVTFADWVVTVTPTGTGFRRGDANADGGTNLADAVATFNFLFLGGDEPPCLDAADTNDADDALNLTDGVYLLNFLFLGGDAPPDPGPFECGPEGDGSPVSFGCETYTACDVGG